MIGGIFSPVKKSYKCRQIRNKLKETSRRDAGYQDLLHEYRQCDNVVWHTFENDATRLHKSRVNKSKNVLEKLRSAYETYKDCAELKENLKKTNLKTAQVDDLNSKLQNYEKCENVGMLHTYDSKMVTQLKQAMNDDEDYESKVQREWEEFVKTEAYKDTEHYKRAQAEKARRQQQYEEYQKQQRQQSQRPGQQGQRQPQSSRNKNPYAVLGVKHGATAPVIRKAYLKLSLLWHPDKNNTKEAHEKFIEINNAYEMLMLTQDQRGGFKIFKSFKKTRKRRG